MLAALLEGTDCSKPFSGCKCCSRSSELEPLADTSSLEGFRQYLLGGGGGECGGAGGGGGSGGGSGGGGGPRTGEGGNNVGNRPQCAA